MNMNFKEDLLINRFKTFFLLNFMLQFFFIAQALQNFIKDSARKSFFSIDKVHRLIANHYFNLSFLLFCLYMIILKNLLSIQIAKPVLYLKFYT